MVEEIRLSPDLVVRIRNVGNHAVTKEFWVELYLDPNPAPTGVNQLWQDVGKAGAAWGVTGDALPLAPGQSLVLTVGDHHFAPAYSLLPEQLTAGTQVYAQVDSWDPATAYGAVLENHEYNASPYNNLYGPISLLEPATFVSTDASPASVAASALPGRPTPPIFNEVTHWLWLPALQRN